MSARWQALDWLAFRASGGTTFREAHLVMELLHDSGLVHSVDIVELNPFLDERGRTARAMVGEWEAFSQRMDGVKGLTRGRLQVAVVSTAKYFMPRLLGSFCALHPAVDVQLQVLNRDGVVARLRDSLDDLYIMSMPPADMALDDRVFMANPLVLIAPAGHRLVGLAQPTLADLQGERFVLRERGSGTRIAVDAHFRQCGFQPSVRLELGSNEAVKESVAGGLGLAVLSVHALGPSVGQQGVVLLPAGHVLQQPLIVRLRELAARQNLALELRVLRKSMPVPAAGAPAARFTPISAGHAVRM